MQRYNNICHSDDHMKEESRTPLLYAPEILRFALDDKGKPSIMKKCKYKAFILKKYAKKYNFSPVLFADSPKSRTFALCFS